jgi:hypothetical protein
MNIRIEMPSNTSMESTFYVASIPILVVQVAWFEWEIRTTEWRIFLCDVFFVLSFSTSHCYAPTFILTKCNATVLLLRLLLLCFLTRGLSFASLET